MELRQESYTAYLRFELGLTPHSIEAYLRDITKLTDWATSRVLDEGQIDYKQLQTFLSSLYDLGIQARSIARIISGLRSYFRWLVLEGYIETDPTELIETPRFGQHLPSVLSVKQIDNILEAIRSKGGQEAQRNIAIIETLFSCGLRVTELCKLKHSDYFPSDGYLRILGKGRKQRLVPLSPSAIAEIENYLSSPERTSPKRGEEDYIFLSRRGSAISRIMVFVMIKEAVALAGIEINVSPHTFRHSFATSLLEGGANLQAIQLMLGHEDIGTTEIYTHLDRSKLREQIEQFHPRNKPSALSD